MTAATGRHPPRDYGGPQHRIAKPVGRRGGVVLMPGHAAREQGRTLFPSTVVHASQSPRVLIDGINQRKIGRKVTKGRWTGMRIFTLTLEERATCPRACQQWDSCYGNNMPYARRHIGGAEFEAKLDAELMALNRRHPRGFVVRLHILGDFYSLAYARYWQVALDRFPALRVFGYTAHAPESEIGAELLRASLDRWDRFALRFSGAGLHALGAETIERDETTPHIICPAQTGKTDCCATCALCWGTDRTIAFLRH
ncbi:hypothetical protein [Sphingobium sp. B2]|uniref:GP88 family protein n=1 Tax=Sphingobium sp. B2 TaxID=2583228 RepID=UPI0011A152ED|nr:hypothetical protein [Sphingobium sp. B2]